MPSKSSKINVTRCDFLNSFRTHYNTYLFIPEDERYRYAKRLILFYAVECGLKCQIMKDEMLKDYDELARYAKDEFGHDIREMLKDRGMDRDYVLKDLLTAEGRRVEPKNLNQFWRYGAKAEKPDLENKNVKVLGEIAEYLRKRL